MKIKFLFLSLSTVVMLALAGCYGQSRLEKFVDRLNNECPVPAGVMGEMTRVEMQNGNVVVTLHVDDNMLNIEALSANPELLHQTVVTSFNNPTDDMKDLVNELKLCNAGLTYIFEGKYRGKQATVTLTSKEIKALAKTRTGADPDALLDATISITNAQLPVRVDEVTILQSLDREDDCVVYHYDVDESLFSFDDIEDNRELVVSMLTQQLRQLNDDPAGKSFIRACKLADVDIAYCYRGEMTGRDATFVVSIDSI